MLSQSLSAEPNDSSAPASASLVPFPEGLDPTIVRALRSRGIEQLYSHQAEAWTGLRQGNHLVVVPSTFGKTLCYNLPVLQAVSCIPRSCS